jgi:hypothetical protein
MGVRVTRLDWPARASEGRSSSAVNGRNAISMRWKHLFFVFLVIAGGLYCLHVYQQHGGVSGFKSGLGFTNGGAA